MHAVASKAVAGTVTGLPIRRVSRAKTDEAESAFALVVHGSLSTSFGLCIGLTSRHRIRIASDNLIISCYLSSTISLSVFFSQVKPSPTCICTFTHSSIQHTPFLSLSILPSIGLFFFRSHYVPPPPIPTHHLHLRPGSRPFMTPQHYSF